MPEPSRRPAHSPGDPGPHAQGTSLGTDTTGMDTTGTRATGTHAMGAHGAITPAPASDAGANAAPDAAPDADATTAASATATTGLDQSFGKGASPETGESIRTKIRDLVALTGPGLPLISLLARLPGAMAFIGTMLLVATTTGSVGDAGIVAGSLGLGQAAAAPLLGRFADRAGHRPTLLLTALANAAALGFLVIAVSADAPLAAQAGLAAMVGASVPPISALARIRWIMLGRERHRCHSHPERAAGFARPAAGISSAPASSAEYQRLVGTAMSVEGVLDEVSFVAGPAIAGVLAALVHPAAAPLCGAVLVAVFGVLFARHASTPPGRSTKPQQPSPLPLARLSVPLTLMLLQGAIFGSGQAGVTALSTALGDTGLTGLVWAVLGVTSAVVSLGMVALPDRFDLPARLRCATLTLALMALPLLAVDGLVVLTLAIAGLGAGIAPHVITVFGLAERVTPVDRSAEAMTLLVSGVIVGNSAGAMLGGRLADAHDHTAAFAVTAAAAASTLVIALLFARPRWYGRRATSRMAME